MGLAFSGEELTSLLSASSLALELIQSHLDEVKLFLESRDLTLGLILVEGLLGDKLSSQVLDLQGVLLLEGIVFLSHDIAPNNVETVQDLADASFVELALVLLLELLDLLDSLSWDPLVSISILLGGKSGSSLVWLDAEGAADVPDALLAQVLGFLHDLN